MAGKENDWPSCRQLQDLMTDKDFNQIKEVCSGGVVGITKRLGSDPERGLPDPVPDFDRRVEVYGRNTVAERAGKSYLEFLLAALKEHLILLLLFIGTVELVVKLAYESEEDKKEGHGRKDAWIEPLAIYITVAIIVNVAAMMDYNRERLFARLSQQVAASNMRFVIRGGKQVQLTDEDLVVGDILTFNSHLAAMIPADGLLLSGEGVKMDESALTGEPEPMVKDASKPFIVSGTTVTSGQGKMVVIAVGEFSVSGKIKKAVYEDSGEEKPSPLFEKLDKMASQLGRGGTAVAFVVFVTACVQGFAVHRPPAAPTHIIDYLLLAFGILAVAVPEGLPLALTISLAISSNKMSKENNLVKTLDSCETMGSVTTICTDKTGTLTANRMTVQAAYIGAVLFKADDVNPVGPRVKGDTRLTASVKDLTSNLIGVCTMDESQVLPGENSSEPKFLGNPTECAMLRFIDTAGYSYQTIRQETVGRSAATRDKGAARAFSSARKMMSWSVPRVDGGYRIYAKGASEIILDRVESAIGPKGEVKKVSEADKKKIGDEVIAPFAKLAFRTIGLAYKDVDHMPDDTTHPTIKNSDGSQAFLCETGLILVGVLGIADPLRLEVPGAIQQCYHAGIDVRMVTGDNLVTAIAIARKAGILKEDLHFNADGEIKPYRAMEGKTFRQHVYRSDPQNPDAEPEFLQDKFDEIWPFLRVMARSSPEDKLTLAMGLQQSRLFADEGKCKRILRDDKITIFPDHQVIAMTGDGTNDAPALKRADVGFAMGIAGTQIAKDAANIILMDDNFASIVTAAKWGRNVYDSIQKFLQFQLTVNIAILVLSLLVSFSGKEPPLKLLHLLWLNMIMDSLASVAIANEPPNEAQLHRPPVNRSRSIFTDQMWFNMLGQAFYQVFVTVVLLFQPWYLPDMPPEDNGTSQPDPFTGPGSRHYTIIFNTFVLFQLFNQFNSRFLLGEYNIFHGLTSNPIFIVVTLIEFVCQFIMAQFAGTVLQIHPKGLTLKQWLLCLGLGAGPLLWQPCLNLCKIVVDRAAAWLRSVRTKKAKADSATTLGRSSVVSGRSGRMSVRDKE